jgi:hypothetical protein
MLQESSMQAGAPEWYTSYIRCVLASILERDSPQGESPTRHRFEEVRELFSRPYWLDQRSDVPEQFPAVGWVGDGEILHLVTLWKATKEEIRLYEENS